MSILFPTPRLRMYSSPGMYFSVFKDLFSGRARVGNDCQRLEDEIQRRFSIQHSICMPQARVGIYFVIKSIIKPGQKVILSPYTIADVINMVICAGGIPVFADLEEHTCNINPAEVEKLIDDNTGAVMVTHLHGLACPVESIAQICRKRNVPLIEDSAQGFGGELSGKKLGTFGDAGIYSFGRYKNLISFYGGMVVTPHDHIKEKIRAELDSFQFTETGDYAKRVITALVKDIASYPPVFKAIVYWIFRFGHLNDIRAINRLVETELDLSRKEKMPEKYLRKMTPMQARLILSKIDQTEENTAKRIRYAQIYHEGLSDLPELILPPLRTDGSHIYTCYPVRYKNRRALVRWMIKNYRDVTIQHLKNCAGLPAFKDFFQSCPVARATANEVIMLPTYTHYGEEQVRSNVKTIRAFFEK